MAVDELDLGNLIAHLRLDTKAFTGAMSSAKKTIKSITSSFNTMSRVAKASLAIATKSVKAFTAPLRILLKLTVALKVATLALAAATVTAAAKYETFQQQLQTVISTKKKADEAFAESIVFSVKTPFTPEEIIATRVALESVGIRGAAAVNSVALAAAAMNRKMLDVAAAVRSLETEPIRNLGVQLKRQGDEFIFQFQDKMGQAQEIAAAGFGEAQQALLDIFSTKFEGGLERMSITFNGLVSTFRGATTDLRAAFGEGLLDPAKLILNDIINGIATIRGDAVIAGQGFGMAMLNARNVLVSGFDVALMVAKQIAQVLKTEGGLGEVILATFQLASTIVGGAIIEAFKVSLELWKTIGTVIGQGVLNAIMGSTIPGAGLARGQAIGRNLQGKSASELRRMAIDQGFDIGGFQEPIFGSEGFGGIKQIGIKEKDAVRLIADITREIKKLPVEMQLAFAQADPGKIISDSIGRAKDQMQTSISEMGSTALKALQDFEKIIAEKGGTDELNLMVELQNALNIRTKEGEKILADWNARLEMQNENLLAGAQAQSDMTGQTLGFNEALGGTNAQLAEIAASLSNMEEASRSAWESFSDHMDRATDTARNLGKVGIRAFDGLADSLTDLALTGKADFKEMTASILSDLARLLIRAQLAQIVQAVSGGFNIGATAAMGQAFNRGSVIPMALGGVVSRETLVPMANGAVAKIGEAGPEAVLPLQRDASGKLGVRGGGGGRERTKVVVVFSDEELAEAMKTEPGERAFVHIAKRHGLL